MAFAQFLKAKLDYISKIPKHPPGEFQERTKKLSKELLESMTVKLQSVKVSMEEATSMMNMILECGALGGEYADALHSLISNEAVVANAAVVGLPRDAGPSAVKFQSCKHTHMLIPVSAVEIACNPKIAEDTALMGFALSLGKMGLKHPTERTRQHILGVFLSVRPDIRENVAYGKGMTGLRLHEQLRTHLHAAPCSVVGMKTYPDTADDLKIQRPDIYEAVYGDGERPSAGALPNGHAMDKTLISLVTNYIPCRDSHKSCGKRSRGRSRSRSHRRRRDSRRRSSSSSDGLPGFVDCRRRGGRGYRLQDSRMSSRGSSPSRRYGERMAICMPGFEREGRCDDRSDHHRREASPPRRSPTPASPPRRSPTRVEAVLPAGAAVPAPAAVVPAAGAVVPAAGAIVPAAAKPALPGRVAAMKMLLSKSRLTRAAKEPAGDGEEEEASDPPPARRSRRRAVRAGKDTIV